MRIATPRHARSHLLLLATLVLVLGGGSIWLALGTARPLEAPPLPPASNTALPPATPASQPPRSPTATATPSPAATATATPAPQAGRTDQGRNLVAARHNNRPGNMVRYLHTDDQVRTRIRFSNRALLELISAHPAISHEEAPHVHGI